MVYVTVENTLAVLSVDATMQMNFKAAGICYQTFDSDLRAST